VKKITYTNIYGESVTFGSDPPCYLEDLDANSLASSYGTQKAIGQDGETFSGVTLNPRTIIATCGFKGVKGGRLSYAEAERIAQQIYRVFLLHHNGTLTYQNNVGTYWIACRPVELPPIETIAGPFKRFSIELVAEEPFWLSSQPFVLRLGQVQGGKQYPLRYPLVYGQWVKEASINNDTWLTTPVTVQITGTADYILITNETTGEYIRVDEPIEYNQRMIIWTGREPYVELITYDDRGNETERKYANYRLDLGSRYIKLAPGKNRLTLDNGIPGVLPVATVEFYKYYQGV